MISSVTITVTTYSEASASHGLPAAKSTSALPIRLGRAGLHQRDAQRERGRDARDDVVLDAAGRRLHRQAAGRDHQTAAMNEASNSGTHSSVATTIISSRIANASGARRKSGGAESCSATDQQEIAAVLVLVDEAGPGLDQQRVAGPEYDIADLAGNPAAFARDRDDRRSVQVAEIRSRAPSG